LPNHSANAAHHHKRTKTATNPICEKREIAQKKERIKQIYVHNPETKDLVLLHDNPEFYCLMINGEIEGKQISTRKGSERTR
jgi:hypothetical protein